MSTYLTITAAKARLARQYTTLYSPGGALDETLITADITAAEAEVNAYLAARYTIPVTAGLDLVIDWALTLFEYRAYRRAPGADIPEKIKDAAAVVRKALADIAKGTMSLPGATESATTAAGSGFIIVDTNTPEMTRAKLRGW